MSKIGFKQVSQTATLFDYDGKCVATVKLPLSDEIPGAIVWQRRVYVLPQVTPEIGSMERLASNFSYVQARVFVAPDKL